LAAYIVVEWGNNIIKFKGSAYTNYKLMSERFNQPGGTVALGGGLFVDNIYLGGDFVCDFSSNKKHVAKAVFGDIRLEQRGITPVLALKLGAYLSSLDVLFCARFGASLKKTEITSNNFGNLKMPSLSPIVGFGVEKNMSKLAVRFDFDYRFEAEKDGGFSQLKRLTTALDNIDANRIMETKLRTSGYDLRLMLMLYL
jgi:hypothetical protein